MFDFDTPVDRSDSDSIKWQRYRNTDIIPLWVADMDFRSPPEVVRAIKQRADHGVFGYGAASGELRDTIVEMLARKYRWQVDPGWLVWLPGLVTGLNVACRSVGNTGDRVLTTTPIYPPFLTAPGFSGRKLDTVGLSCTNSRWAIDMQTLEAAVTPATHLLLLCNPHNPAGRVFSRKELEDLAEISRRHALIICSDEIHCDLILDPAKQHIPMASLSPAIQQRTITLMAPSKTYNIPGLSCSFAVIADSGLRQSFRKAMAGIVPHVNLFGYVAALAAYRHGERWLAQVLSLLRENHQRVLQRIHAMSGLKTTPVEATYLAWIDARDTGIPKPAAFFEQAGVGLSDGAEFGAPGFVRLNFGCCRSLLETALRRMETALAGRSC